MHSNPLLTRPSAAVTYVLHLLTRRKGRPPVGQMLQDTARWAAFLGSFSGGHLVGKQYNSSRLCELGIICIQSVQLLLRLFGCHAPSMAAVMVECAACPGLCTCLLLGNVFSPPLAVSMLPTNTLQAFSLR